MTWTGYIGIFDKNCGTFSSKTFDPTGIVLSGQIEGINYLILKVVNLNEAESFDLKLMKLPMRKNFAAGIGKVELAVQINGYCTRRENGAEAGSSIIKYNKIKKFCRMHDESSDTPAYLVMRVPNITSGYDYDEFEDDQGNLEIKFLKGKTATLTKKFQQFGHIEYQLQFSEAWIP